MNSIESKIFSDRLCAFFVQAPEPSLVDKIMAANSFESLKDLQLNLDEVLTLFSQAEYQVTLSQGLLPNQIAGILKTLPAAKQHRHLFI